MSQKYSDYFIADLLSQAIGYSIGECLEYCSGVCGHTEYQAIVEDCIKDLTNGTK